MSDGSSTHEDHGHEHYIVPVKAYFGVLVALGFLMALTIGAAFIDLGSFNPILAILIAIAKALFIVLIFMNVYFSTKLTKIFVVGAFFFLIILFGLIIIDFISRTMVSNPQPWN